jgi:AraC-like DNA-binding protein
VDIYTKNQKLKNEFIAASQKRFVGLSAPHGHDFFEIELILGGTGVYVIDGVSYEIEPNTLFLMTPAQIHSVVDADVEIINVMFQCEYDRKFFSFPILNNTTAPVYRLNAKENEFLSSLLQEIIAVHKRNIPYAMLLLRCVLHKLTEYVPTQAEAMPPSYIQHAILYMMENFRTGITLESISAHLGLSKVYFSEYFSKHMGINFKTYLDNLRFSYVENLLCFTDLSVNEIHIQAGFVDYANFARRFKQKYGCAPGEYRKKKQQAL